MKSICVVASILSLGVLSTLPGRANAAIEVHQYGQITLQINTATKETTGWVAGDGTKIRFDNAQGIAYVLENDVVVAQFDLQQVNLQAAGGNPYGAATLTYYQKKGAGMSPQPKSWSSSIHNPYPCAFSPCSPSEGPGINPYYVPSVLPGEEFVVDQGPDGQGTGPSAELLAYDRAQFDRWQNDRCQDAYGWENNLLFGSAVVGTVIACLSVETGIGAAGCVAGYAALVAMAEAQADAERDCNSTYVFNGWG